MMKLDFFCPLWGSDHLPFEAFLEKAKETGYDGVEMSFPLEEHARETLVRLIQKYELKLIAQHWETIDSDFETHKKNYEQRLRNLAETQPLFINSQTGKDYYSFEQNAELFEIAALVADETGINTVHETHRGKFSFAAHVTKNYLDRLPKLELCLDISHWCCVAETFLDDQKEAVDLAIDRTRHIHSRVGFTEGPQVMDPRADENTAIVTTHTRWWQDVVDSIKRKGLDSLTITPEFGAPPYLQLMPYTQEPIYSQWEANVYMMHLLRSKLKL